MDESGLNIIHEAATPAKGNLFDMDRVNHHYSKAKNLKHFKV